MSTTSLAPRPRQLDLFADALTPDQQRYCDALVCLRDAVPTALEVIVELRYGASKDTRAPHAGGSWAYCVSRSGLWVETAHAWWTLAEERGERYGFHRTPASLVTWAELTELVGADPRRAEIAAWVETLSWPRWEQLVRPCELWPDADGWNLRRFCRDHVDRHWPARRRAWELVKDVLNDAIERVTTTR